MHIHNAVDGSALVVHIAKGEIEQHAVSLTLLEFTINGTLTEAQGEQFAAKIDSLIKALQKGETTLTDLGDGVQMYTKVLTETEAQGDEQ